MGNRRKDASSEPPRSGSRPATGKLGKTKARGTAGIGGLVASWPWWVWLLVVIGLLASMGRLFAGEDSGSRKSRRDRAGSAKKSSVQGELAAVMRLSELTQLAADIVAVGAMDESIAKEIDEELAGIEEDAKDFSDKMSRDILAMVSVVRGTVHQKSQDLSDEDVEKLNNSFTYANPKYWEDYYGKTSNDERYDWYITWSTRVAATTITTAGGSVEVKNLADVIRPYLQPDSKILMLGCGNSDMSEQMYLDGYEDIFNIDISEKVIENMQSRLQAKLPKMRWQAMSAAELALNEAAFDVAIEKGTFDAIEQNKPLLSASVKEAQRILKPGGLLISITFNSAEVRVEAHLQAAPWSKCESHKVLKDNPGFEAAELQSQTGPSSFYVHICSKA